MTNHTKGPWAVNGHNLAEVIAIRNGPDAQGRSYIDGRHQVSVAIVPTGGNRDFEAVIADTRLIAAAPEMLRILEDALLDAGVGWQASIPEDEAFKLPTWVHEARRVVKRARGE